MNLWGGRYIILGSMLAFLVAGSFYIWRATPIYQADAMMQIEPPKTARDSDAAYARMENMFSAPSEASTETEIIASNLVLGRTVQSLSLDVVAQPVLFPLIGAALVRGKVDAPQVEVAKFNIPDYMRGLTFELEALPNGSFTWKAPQSPPSSGGKLGAAYPLGKVLATGPIGDDLVGSFGGEPIKLNLRLLVAKPGQKFLLYRKPMLAAIGELRSNLDIAEKGTTQPGKASNLLALTFRHNNAAKAAEILNEIMKQYVNQNSERKREEISSALALLQQQLPQVHGKLKSSESQMSGFRSQSGAVDVSKEADLALQQSSNLTAQISALKQKKQEMLRTYQETSDVVATLNAQIDKLEGEVAAVNRKVRTLPGKQQAVVGLSRDVQVNTELYTALLNNIKQLQITQAGDGRNSTRIVDIAMPGLNPIKPKKGILMAVFFSMGLLLGVGLVLGRMALWQGVEDHRLIEVKLGLPVLTTIPNSPAQEEHYRALSESRPGSHLLAHHDPEDLATESLRSLRTMLKFSTVNASNNAIMVTGPSPKVGKTFISSNFAVVLAQAGSKVLVVDADMRRGNLHKYFGLPHRKGGLSEVITGQMEWESAVHETETPGLFLMSSGWIPKNPAELLMAKTFDNFLIQASKQYDYVVIDAPPLLPVTDASIIGSKVGTILLVTKFGQHSLDEIRTCQDRLESNGLPLKGCVFNNIQPTGLGYFDQRYRYAYHYKYGLPQ
jgi:tyrosine-protein kinase Etk/Wzc